MKAITLWQPWAFLVMLAGHPDPDIAKLGKHFETRSWHTVYRGQLAIHAAKYIPPEAEELCLTVPFQKAFEAAGIKYNGDVPLNKILPRGVILGTCNLVSCLRIEDRLYHPPSRKGGLLVYARPLPKEPELSFGDYTPGRFAWVLEDVRQLPEPIPAVGRQSLWTWEPPKEIAV